MGVVEHVADDADAVALALQDDRGLDELGEVRVLSGVHVGSQRGKVEAPQELLDVLDALVELVVAEGLKRVEGCQRASFTFIRT